MKIHYLYFYLLILLISPLCNVSDARANDNIQERIYLQTDKQTYLAGELAWIKLLTSNIDGKPLSLSKTAYVELLDSKNSVVQTKIDVSKGIGQGWMIFPASLSTGYYRLVAYTNYMKNEGAEVFFEKNIVIINPNQNQNPSSSENNSYQPSSGSQEKNTITVSTRSSSFSTRELVEISLDKLPADIHSLSVSVTGKDLVNTTNSDILTWKNQLYQTSNHSFSGKYIPEYEGHIVRGRLVDVNTGSQVYDNIVTPLISFIGDDIRLFTGKSDPAGNILFPTVRSSGRKEMVSTFAGSENEKYRIDIESPYFENHIERKLPAFGYNGNIDELLKRNVGLQVQYSYLTDSINTFDVISSYMWQKPSQSYVLDEYTRFHSMPEIFTEFVAFASFKRLNGKRTLTVFRENIGFLTGSSFVLLDGILIFDHETIYNYNPALVKRIDVYQDKFIFGGLIAEGIVSLTTYKNDYPDLKLDSRSQINDYGGTQAHRRFYMPTYENEGARSSRMPDFRHTLLWNPDLQTNGRTSIIIPLYTSDLADDYIITVEGLTKDGTPIRATSTFTVK